MVLSFLSRTVVKAVIGIVLLALLFGAGFYTGGSTTKSKFEADQLQGFKETIERINEATRTNHTADDARIVLRKRQGK